MEYTVRRAEQRDIPAIMRLLLQVDMVHHLGRPDIFRGPATKYSAEELTGILADDSAPVFVCVGGDDVPLGHAFCVHRQVTDHPVLTDIRTLYIDDICVDSSARGRGIGRALYEHTVAYARERGFYNINLNVWSCNSSAMRFYEAMGLVPQKVCMEQIL